MLTDNQIEHFNTFGFIKMNGVFSSDEMDEIRRASLITMNGLRDGSGFNTTDNQSVQPWLERHPSMENLIDDERIYQIGESLCGPGFWLDGTEGHLRIGDTAWHGDRNTPEDLPWIKIALYMDPLTRKDGCLRIIPGSQVAMRPDPYQILREVSTDPRFMPFGVRPDQIPAVALETNPGDLIVFTERVLHGAFGGGNGRHQICVSFVGELNTEVHLDFVRQFYQQTSWSVRPTRTYVDSARPRIRRIVETPLKLGFEVLEI